MIRIILCALIDVFNYKFPGVSRHKNQGDNRNTKKRDRQIEREKAGAGVQKGQRRENITTNVN